MMHLHRRNDGFTIVEIVIAALILAACIAGASILAASSFKSLGVTKVKDRQSSAGQALLQNIQADNTWIKQCRDTWPKHSTITSMNCASLPAYIKSESKKSSSPYSKLTVISGDKQKLTFQLTAAATGYDLKADGIGDKDLDGLVPDYFAIRLVLAPTKATLARYPKLTPFVVTASTNQSSAAETGTLTVRACGVTTQWDARMAVGECSSVARSEKLLAPGGGCAGVVHTATNTGSQPASAWPSCRAWTTSPEWTHDMKLVPINGSVSIIATSGSAKGKSWPARPLKGGVALFTRLPEGTYQVKVNQSNGLEPWSVKSVPANGQATVTAGLNSVALQMYRPPNTGKITIPVTSTNGNGPPWDGFGKEVDGLIPELKNRNYYFIVVPAPVGRIDMATFTKSSSAPLFRQKVPANGAPLTFTGLPPGLYTSYVANDDLNIFQELGGTCGYIWVAPNGAQGANCTPAKAGADFKIHFGFCQGPNPPFIAPPVTRYGSPGTKITGPVPVGGTKPATWTIPDCGSSGGGPGAIGGKGSSSS